MNISGAYAIRPRRTSQREDRPTRRKCIDDRKEEKAHAVTHESQPQMTYVARSANLTNTGIKHWIKLGCVVVVVSSHVCLHEMPTLMRRPKINHSSMCHKSWVRRD